MKAGGQIGIEGTLCHQSTWCCVPLSLSPTMTTEVAVNAVPINFNINNELTLLAWFFASLALKPLKTVAASLRRQGLRAKASRRFSPVSYREHSLPGSENLLKQDFYASGPNQKWVGDITYLRTGEGWLYLAVVIDLWSRSVIGWSMSSRMTAQLACDALQMALWRRKRPENVIVHTDRGGQYCSTDYQSLLKRHNLRGSMSTKGCCYDNACAESDPTRVMWTRP
ncbi:IS3 transposase B [Citrobacter freundii]|nr:IS3 transposase B [Citrobacter freundii]